MIILRAQERAHSLKTLLPSTESSSPATKHRSAFARSAVRSKASKYKLFMCSSKTWQKSASVAYCMVLSFGVCFAFLIFTSAILRSVRVTVELRDVAYRFVASAGKLSEHVFDQDTATRKLRPTSH